MNLFGARTVASITSSLKKIAASLHQHVENMRVKHAEHSAEITRRSVLMAQVSREAAHASAVAEKINGLIEPTNSREVNG